MMTRDQAIAAYNRVKAWESSVSKRLLESVLVRFFGGCGCRMHNCRVNYESGFSETPVVVDGVAYSHAALAKLSKRFDYEQTKLWREASRLQEAFAVYF